ncbi:MAG: tRNA-dihydrouridine synthase [Lentimicrobium sp.]|nr:tRNA-dihydrouridine synthase [Lentimicrobium sp.]
MEDVTDTVFRELVMSVSLPGKLHLLFTEFTSVDGLCHPVGREAVIHRLFVNESEQEFLNKYNVKLVAQLWGNDPEKFYKASQYIAKDFHFDGIDINMGCPVDKVVKQNSCSALISQPDLALEIIDATIKGSGMPVSVKTRTGIKDHQTAKWIDELLQSDLSAITLHARTQKMQSLFPAEWEQVKIAVAVKEEIRPEVRILGNGDVSSWQNGKELMLQTGADGVMVGRGIFANPWFFAENDVEREVHAKVGLLENHIRLFSNTWKSMRNFSILKRFFKIYVNGFSGASAFRASLMETHNAPEALQVIRDFRENHLLQTDK